MLGHLADSSARRHESRSALQEYHAANSRRNPSDGWLATCRRARVIIYADSRQCSLVISRRSRARQDSGLNFSLI